jgi:hypothetical protein
MSRLKGWAAPRKAKGVWHFFPNGTGSVCGRAKSALGTRRNKAPAGATLCRICVSRQQ